MDHGQQRQFEVQPASPISNHSPDTFGHSDHRSHFGSGDFFKAVKEIPRPALVVAGLRPAVEGGILPPGRTFTSQRSSLFPPDNALPKFFPPGWKPRLYVSQDGRCYLHPRPQSGESALADADLTDFCRDVFRRHGGRKVAQPVFIHGLQPAAYLLEKFIFGRDRFEILFRPIAQIPQAALPLQH